MTRRDALPLLVVALSVLLFYHRVAFLGEGFYYRDLTTASFPRESVVSESVRAGELPLWNPRVNLGEPLIANPNNVALHPQNLLFRYLRFFRAFNLAILGELVLAALAFYLFARQLGVRPSAAIVVTFGYAFSGFVVSSGNLWNGLATLAPAPLALAAAAAAARSRSRLGALAMGAALALQVLGGEPVTGLLTAATASAWLLLAAEGATRRERMLLGALRLAEAALWAILLSLVQTVPAIELLADTARGAGLAEARALAWSVHPATLLEVLVPGVYGNPLLPTTPYFWGGEYLHRSFAYILSLGVGKPTLALALLAAAAPLRRARLFALAVLAALVLALGSHTPVYRLAYEHVPFLSAIRYPVKFFFLVNLGLSAMAGLGLERALAGAGPTRAERLASWTLAGLALLCVPVAFWVARPPHPALVLLPALRSAIVLAGALVAVSALRARRSSALALLALLAFLEGGELWPAHHGMNPSAPEATLSRAWPVTEWLARDPEPYRIHRIGYPIYPRPPRDPVETTVRARAGLIPNYGMALGVAYGLNQTADAMDWDGMRVLRSRTCDARDPALAHAASAAAETHEDMARILGLANVRYVLSEEDLVAPSLELVTRLASEEAGDLRIYRNHAALPRVFLAGERRRIPDLHEACLALRARELDPQETVIVASGDSGGGPLAVARAELTSYRGDRVVVDTESSGPATLVVLDSFAPGWTATVDGAAAEVVRANVCFRAVAVGAGRHRVELRYRPRTLFAAGAVSLAALLAALLRFAWVVATRRAATARGPAGSEDANAP